MTTTVYATFDGDVLRPEGPLELAPNTRVRVTIETAADDAKPGRSFLRAAMDIGIEGPRDWSERLDDYLYGDAADDRG